MIQLMICLAVAICGALSLALYCKREESGNFAVAASLIIAIVISAVMFVTMSILVISTYISGPAEIIEFEQTRAAVETIKSGDPSYSGILQDALEKNKNLAVSKVYNQSIWWDWFYNDECCKLELIKFPGQAKKPEGVK